MSRLFLIDGLNEPLMLMYNEPDFLSTKICESEYPSFRVGSLSPGVLGGTRNTMQVFLSNTVAFANINPNNAVEIYAPDAGILDDEYIAEKLETKAGWNFASPDEDWMRGYPQELEDFIDCILKGKEPISGLDLAEDTLKVVYAGYLSAEKGKRVQIP